MTATDDDTAFLTHIKADPLDTARRLVYADWLDDHDRPADALEQRLLYWTSEVCKAPEDDAPRLDYAAVCEAYGETTRAEFIRVQCELAKEIPPAAEAELYTGGVQSHLDEIDHLVRRPAVWSRICKTLRRLEELGESCNWWGWMSCRSQGVQMVPRRGFVSEVTCTADVALRHLDSLTWGWPKCESCNEGRVGQHFDPSSGEMRGGSRCPACSGTVRVSPTMACPRCDGEGGERDLTCFGCHGHGRVPRPMPPTAQPITDVHLTTPTALVLRETDLNWGNVSLIRNREERAVGFTCDRFAGITFHLPENNR